MNDIQSLEKIIKYQKDKYNDYPAQEHFLIQLCIRTGNKIEGVISDELGNYEINNTIFMILFLLYVTDGYSSSPSEISNILQISKTSVTRIADSLENQGFVNRIDNKCDRRSKVLSLTQEGIIFIQRVMHVQNKILKKIWGGLSEDELNVFESINKKILSNIDNTLN